MPFIKDIILQGHAYAGQSAAGFGQFGVYGAGLSEGGILKNFQKSVKFWIKFFNF